jgi:serine/threonine-protein kinase HipA
MASECFVHLQLPGTTEVVPCGRFLTTGDGRTPGVGRYVYGRSYRVRLDAVAVDPYNLPIVTTPAETTDYGGIFGALRDASPDAWGRRIIEASLGRPDLTEVDYLLHAGQEHVGALTFGLSATPPAPVRAFNRVVDLAELMTAATTILTQDSSAAALDAALSRLLEAPGTSMGGARPKSVIRDRGRLWIAKFPHPSDRWNVAAVEGGLLRLARRCGIPTPDAEVHDIGDHRVLLVARFDRERAADAGDDFVRHRVLSAATVLRADDGGQDRSRWSYLELADELQRYSADPRADKVDLFRRIVFNALTSNTDDHPRNHCLVARDREFRLAPAYDLTPAPRVASHEIHLAMRCGRAGTIARRQNIVASAAVFGLTSAEATETIDEMQAVVAANWERDVRRHGATDADVAAVAPAFGNPGFEYEVEVPIHPGVLRRRLDGY